MSFDNLNEREKSILYNLINYYISSADPVGSRVMANRFSMGISSATIRNVLQDLEDMGLVKQPHTSAGRVPTELGYRVYVDTLFKPEDLTAGEKETIRNGILQSGRGLNEVLGQTCRILGQITNELGVSIGPKFEAGVLKRIELIQVASERVMVVVVLSSGLARSVILEVEANLTEAEIYEVEATLNERLSGVTLEKLRQTIAQRLADTSGHGRLIHLLMESSEKIWKEDPSKEIHVAGMDRLLAQPEFSDVQKVASLIKLLDDGKLLSEFFKGEMGEGLVIAIGKENRISQILNCSMVSSTYRVGDLSGTIAVIGPTRMPYEKLVSVVEYTARTMSDVLGGIDSKQK